MMQMNSPMDEVGLNAMADWLAPRIKESPLWEMSLSTHDSELIAIMLEQLIPEYFETINFPAVISRKGTLVYMKMNEDDADSEAINVSVPFAEAIMARLGIRPVF